MDVTIKDKKENASLNRQELFCEVTFDKAMPSRKQLREAICAATGVPPELLVIVSAKGGFGTAKAVVEAHAYKDKGALSVERRYLLVRDGLLEKQKKAAKAAPAKK
ncbi:30S ribosomal protein S24e [uncultured archaeon]|nr:30S ribosomal protein S24e [uncultured archaeon]